MSRDVNNKKSIVQYSRRQSRVYRMVMSPLFCSIIAAFGVLGGISALFIGLVCVVIHSLFPADSAFDTVATYLLIAAIPMVLIGAIFLDEIEENK